jgi:hypothetical protein
MSCCLGQCLHIVSAHADRPLKRFLRKYQTGVERFKTGSLVAAKKMRWYSCGKKSRFFATDCRVQLRVHLRPFAVTSFQPSLFRTSFLARRPPCNVVSAEPLSPFFMWHVSAEFSPPSYAVVPDVGLARAVQYAADGRCSLVCTLEKGCFSTKKASVVDFRREGAPRPLRS